MSPLFLNLVRTYIGAMVVLYAGWLGATLLHNNQLVESWIRLDAQHFLPVPWELPRVFGLMWLSTFAGLGIWSETRQPGSQLEVNGAAILVGLLALIAGLLSLVAYWFGAWVTLAATIALAAQTARVKPNEELANVLVYGLVVATAVGAWSGFFTGLYHGLLFVIVYLGCDVTNRFRRLHQRWQMSTQRS